MKSIRLIALLALLGCSHDVKRENPLDPELTPPVTLTAVMDSTSGVVSLSWTPYSGDTRFASYQVLRNVADRIDVDTLAAITEAEQTTYTDASLAANTAYEYRILVVNGEGFSFSSERSHVGGFTVRAVTLLAAAGDPSTGIIGIVWTRYRDPGFESYQLFRRVVGTDAELLLSDISSVTDTTFADTAARHEVIYIYRVEAQTSSGSLSSTGLDAVLTLPAVTITGVEFDAPFASAALEWTSYSGARFSHYRIERQTAGMGFQSIGTADVSTDTSFLDTGLIGNTEYSYRVITVTAAAEEINSNEVGDALHRFERSWPQMSPGRSMRLYADSDGVSAVESFGSQATRGPGVWLIPYGSGELKEERLEGVPLSDAVATTLTHNGHRLTSWADWEERSVSVLGNDTRGPRTDLEAPAGFTSPLQNFAFSVAGRGPQNYSNFKGLEFLAVETVVRESFAGLPRLGPDESAGFSTPGAIYDHLVDWEVVSGAVWGYDDRLVLHHGTLFRRRTEAVTDFQLTVTSFMQGGRGGVSVGSEDGAHVELIADAEEHRAVLTWTGLDAESGEAIADSVSASMQFVHTTPYLFTLVREGGALRASIESLSLWDDQRDEVPLFTSLARFDDLVLLGVGNDLVTIDDEGNSEIVQTFASIISDVKVWDDSGVVGVCLPEINRVAIGVVLGGSILFPSTREIGDGFSGSRPGQFNYPVSIDAGPDGRVYVLDAGNSRIQVFDSRGKYITEWGEFGNGEGQFDFGDGSVSFWGVNLFGGLAVDDAGFIYVSDFGQRIQKFAP